MRAIGIDLGTTNSCVAVVDEDGVRVLTDDQGQATVPSVVARGRDGQLHVGQHARNLVGSDPPPIFTIKRKMGSTETVRLGDEEKTAVEVSALILAHLKELAEARLGHRVTRAVVTVPAYFSHVQKQQTDEAAHLAGFRQIVTLLEPVAAALAHSLSSASEHLRVFVYDLGGGTFDATVLEKDRDGGITVLSFGGDPFLGGDDIDGRLTRHLLERLRETGYRLDLDLDTPADRSRYLQLKSYAEHAKKELSSQQEVTLVRQGLFEDQAGEMVDLDLVVTRAELETCAEDLIQRTLEASRTTLAKNGIEIGSIDELILVGGMSRMPRARQLLGELFKRQPREVDPDLIVAQGAAIKATEVFGEQITSTSGLGLDLHYDRRTDQPQVRISGTFDRPLAGHTLYLMRDDLELFVDLDGRDRFTFETVPITPGTETVWSLSLEDTQDNVVLERELRIVHDPAARRLLASPGSVIAKPISVQLRDHFAELFGENTALPHIARHSFETADQSGTILAPIYEGHHEVARLGVHDLPTDLKVGTAVEVELRAEADYTITALARVPELDRQAAIEFRIEPVDTAGLTPEAVRERLAELELEAAEATRQARPEAVERFRFRYGLLRDEIEVELGELEPQKAKLHEKLGEISRLIQSLTPREEAAVLTPTFEEWSTRLGEIVDQAIDQEHPRLAEQRPHLEQLRSLARDAWERRDSIAWRRANDQLTAVAMALQPELPPAVLAMGLTAGLLREELPALRAAGGQQHADELGAIETECQSLLLELQLGAVDGEQAKNRILSLYQTRIQPLRRQLGLAQQPQPQMADPAAALGLLRSRS